MEPFKAELEQIEAASLLLERKLSGHIVRGVIQKNLGDHTEIQVILNNGDTLTREQIAKALGEIGYTLITEVASAAI